METNIHRTETAEGQQDPSGILVLPEMHPSARTPQLWLSFQSEAETLGFTPSVWRLCHTVFGLSRQGQLYKGLNCHLSDTQELAVVYWSSSRSAALSPPNRAGGKGPAEPLWEFLSQNAISLHNLTASVCHRLFINHFPVTRYLI